MVRATPPTVLTIAGSDSGGGAGIAADLRTFAAHAVHGAMAVTVVTAQNTIRVEAAHPIPASIVAAQIEAVVEDFDVRGAKTGLLWGVDTVRAVVELAGSLPNLVVDPVLVTSRREPMLGPAVEAAYRSDLLGCATVATPNVAEAALLSGIAINSRTDAVDAAQRLLETGAAHVVVTGFLDGGDAIDIHASGSGVRELARPLVNTRNIHGTGCTFAAAVAARLALGDSPTAAIDASKDFVTRAIVSAAAWSLGDGQGPIDQFSGHA